MPAVRRDYDGSVILTMGGDILLCDDHSPLFPFTSATVEITLDGTSKKEDTVGHRIIDSVITGAATYSYTRNDDPDWPGMSGTPAIIQDEFRVNKLCCILTPSFEAPADSQIATGAEVSCDCTPNVGFPSACTAYPKTSNHDIALTINIVANDTIFRVQILECTLLGTIDCDPDYDFTGVSDAIPRAELYSGDPIEFELTNTLMGATGQSTINVILTFS